MTAVSTIVLDEVVLRAIMWSGTSFYIKIGLPKSKPYKGFFELFFFSK